MSYQVLTHQEHKKKQLLHLYTKTYPYLLVYFILVWILILFLNYMYFMNLKITQMVKFHHLIHVQSDLFIWSAEFERRSCNEQYMYH